MKNRFEYLHNKAARKPTHFSYGRNCGRLTLMYLTPYYLRLGVSESLSSFRQKRRNPN
ncbi:MAG: hypothetical protein QXQ39_02945 [Conexivisphaerales archaeon]